MTSRSRVLAIAIVVIALAFGGLSSLPAPAAGRPPCSTPVEVVQTTVVQGMFEQTVILQCPTVEADPSTQPSLQLNDGVADGYCNVLAALAVFGQDIYCDDAEPEAEPEVTPGLVLQAFRRTSPPASTLQVQPPNGRTLVNFDTNFYTDRNDFTRTVTLLGQQVQLRIFATTYTWHFDDGQPLTTTTPGAPHPDLQVTHDYQTKGTYNPRVDTTYGADWRVGNGTWQRVPGTVTIEGQPVDLDAVEARPTLVS